MTAQPPIGSSNVYIKGASNRYSTLTRARGISRRSRRYAIFIYLSCHKRAMYTLSRCHHVAMGSSFGRLLSGNVIHAGLMAFNKCPGSTVSLYHSCDHRRLPLGPWKITNLEEGQAQASRICQCGHEWEIPTTTAAPFVYFCENILLKV